MTMERDYIFLLFLCSSIAVIAGSKCPETRKPHVTSCTIFYNCINLPEGGYVWAPSKCPDGLVFQPYLRICVLPGDSWTCDTLATESSLLSEHYERPELIDPALTSYLGYTQVSPPLAGHPSIAASYPIDGISELDNLRPAATPYPLIEIVDTNEKNVNNNNNEDGTKNTAIPHAIGHREENYLYQFFNSQQQLPAMFGGITNTKGLDNHFTWLKGFINKMLLYENIGIPLRQQMIITDPVITHRPSTTCQPTIENTLKKNEYLNNINSDILGYIVQSYILGTKQSMQAKSKKKTKKPESTTSQDLIDANVANTNDSPVDPLINGLKTDNSVVIVKGNLGGKEYITIEKYKSLSSQTRLEVIGILPCAKGIRLPNSTDCAKYYTCDPETAVVVDFRCSSKTAFNDYARVCETQRYKACTKQMNEPEMFTESTSIHSIVKTSTSSQSEEPKNVEPCQTIGKFSDPISENHYYVCYSSQANSGTIESIRMTCPNDLIFCQERRVCTTRKRCYD